MLNPVYTAAKLAGLEAERDYLAKHPQSGVQVSREAVRAKIVRLQAERDYLTQHGVPVGESEKKVESIKPETQLQEVNSEGTQQSKNSRTRMLAVSICATFVALAIILIGVGLAIHFTGGFSHLQKI
jgi:hypothetical protein